MKYIFSVILVVLLTPFYSVFADEIVLVNGDRLTGTVRSSDGNVVMLETDYSDPIKISKTKVKRIYVNESSEIRLSGGEVLKGTIRSEGDGKIIIDGVAGRQAVTADWNNVTALNPPSQQLSKWTGDITVGAGLQSGNSDRTNMSVGASATRKSSDDRLSLGLAHNYAEEEKKVSSRNSYGFMKYDYFITEKYYIYLGTELLKDSFKNLNLRTVIGPGLGYQVWDYADKSLLFEAGLSYFSEDIKVGKDDSWLTARLAGNVRYNLMDAAVLTDHLIVYPSLEDFGQYTLRNEAAITSPLASGWSLKLANILERDSNPPLTIKKSDWYWILGLQYGF
ncbi:DUF481 domain-containing protein [bacterium]|nr:DUF481 domain-containing protein [bacterium]